MVQQDIRWIQRFKHTHEPAWKVLKDYVEIKNIPTSAASVMPPEIPIFNRS